MGDTPNIRFKGFTDDWEQRKFGDLGSVAMCKRIFKEQTTTVGEIPFYKIGTFGGEPDAFITRELYEDYKEKFQYPEIGDMLISASGTIGRTVEYTGEDAYFQDSNIVWFKHDDSVDNSFLKCVYVIVRWSGIEGSTIKRLYNDNFLKTEFGLPQIEEQKEIGAFFTTLDTLITLHQNMCDETKELKKYMLQKMFPQNGQTVPEIRFAGFTGGWERHKFSNIVIEKLTNGIMNQQSDSRTDIRHINVINMYVFDKIHVEDLAYSSCNSIAAEKCNVEIGDIFLTRSSLKPEGIAEPNVLLDDGCFVFDDHLIRMKVNKEKYDPLFTKILLSTKPVKKQFIAKSKQNAFTTIGQEDIVESEGLFPLLSEQQEIGKYFSNIDNLITLHQNKCDALKQVKKFMLQNMFPQKG